MTFSTMIDTLYCQEEHLDLFDYNQEEDKEIETTTPVSFVEEEKQTNIQLLYSLCHKETETSPSVHMLNQIPCSLSYLLSGARRDMVAWLTRAVAHHSFTTQTALLSTNYLDRCFLSGVLQLQPDKPWMGRLAAVACLSLAAKVEEIRVPLLLDLQLLVAWEDDTGTNGGDRFLFEAKTVRRMELLVLSALQWRLHSVTTLSFIQPLVSLLSDEKKGYYDLTARCEGTLLSLLDDWRWVKYTPSVWATAILVHELEFDETECIMSLINVSKEKVQECCDLIRERMNASNRKRKHFHCKCCQELSPASPHAVVDTCFSCDSSSGSDDSLRSWSSSTTSSPDRPVKRTHYSSLEYYNSLLRDEESRLGFGL